MTTWIVSYADGAFRTALARLMASAARAGIDERRPWDRDMLERTAFYRTHRSILDRPRGGGYWLWKPFIISEVLKEAAPGDLLIYSDAGIEIVDGLEPLFDLCRQHDVLLFAGHYDDVGGPGPNVCRKWVKRDCFVAMDCDEARVHDGQMIDASFIVLAHTARAVAFVHTWLAYCCQDGLITDEPNRCDLPNLPGFVAHRHDQALLSLLAHRERLELFRHPSQHGNHLKDVPYRVSGEWLRHPYGTKGIFHNSPYPTLLHHHRGHLGQAGLRVTRRRTLAAPRAQVFDAWTRPDIVKRWSPLGYRLVSAEADVRVGGRYRFTFDNGVDGKRFELTGVYADVQPPDRLVYTWSWNTEVTVAFHERGDATELALVHEPFSSEQLCEYHVRGWDAFLDTLAAALADDAAVTHDATVDRA